MRRALFVTAALAALVALGGCAGAGVRTLTAEDDGTTISVGAEDTLVVELPSNPTTGYSWQVAESGPFDTSSAPEFIADETREGVVGAGGIERFTFTRAGSGSGTLRLEYRRPWEDETVPAEDTWSVTVK